MKVSTVLTLVLVKFGVALSGVVIKIHARFILLIWDCF